jgi:hypothetical protein
VDVVRHINEVAYSNTEENDTKPLFLALQLGADRIFYQRDQATGSIHVLVGDFYCASDSHRVLRNLSLYFRLY